MMEAEDAVNYRAELLKSFNLAEVQMHKLNLNIRVLIIMLRNMNLTKLCKGTRLVDNKLRMTSLFQVSLSFLRRLNSSD